MNKAVIILVSMLWLLCATYLTLARLYDYPYKTYAMAGSWIASALLLICVVVFIKKNKGK